MLTAERLGLSSSEVKRIGLAAELHDVRKTAIPDANEWGFMRRHTLIGERIILAAPSLAPTAGLVRSSHEAFDGSGYPDALRGDAIPLGARIIAVCDGFDAMISERSYRGALPVEDAITEPQRCAGTQFDPDVVAVFSALTPLAPTAAVVVYGRAVGSARGAWTASGATGREKE
jgi:response regulator RpfG family c-di-GMP phosphodiesterase